MAGFKVLIFEIVFMDIARRCACIANFKTSNLAIDAAEKDPRLLFAYWRTASSLTNVRADIILLCEFIDSNFETVKRESAARLRLASDRIEFLNDCKWLGGSDDEDNFLAKKVTRRMFKPEIDRNRKFDNMFVWFLVLHEWLQTLPQNFELIKPAHTSSTWRKCRALNIGIFCDILIRVHT